jgi:hypothetical protein
MRAVRQWRAGTQIYAAVIGSVPAGQLPGMLASFEAQPTRVSDDGNVVGTETVAAAGDSSSSPKQRGGSAAVLPGGPPELAPPDSGGGANGAGGADAAVVDLGCQGDAGPPGSEASGSGAGGCLTSAAGATAGGGTAGPAPADGQIPAPVMRRLEELGLTDAIERAPSDDGDRWGGPVLC